MTSKELSYGILRTILLLSGVLLLLFLLYKIAIVIVYVIIAVVFSLIANPLVTFLKNKMKFRNTIAVITTLFIFIALFVSSL